MADAEDIRRRGGHRKSVTGADTTHMETKEGYLKKKSTKGVWNKRFFLINNRYFLYHRNARKNELLAVIKVTDIDSIDLQGRFGEFVLSLSGGTELALKAADAGEANVWIQALRERLEYFEQVERVEAEAGAVAPDGRRASNVAPVTQEVAAAAAAAEGLMIEGWLNKKAPAFFVKWQERYCRIEDAAFSYFRSKEEADRNEAAGCMSLDAIVSVGPIYVGDAGDSVQEGGGLEAANTFELTVGQRQFIFRAESGADSQRWIDAVQRGQAALAAAAEVTEASRAVATLSYRVRQLDALDEAGQMDKVQEDLDALFQDAQQLDQVAVVLDACVRAMEDLQDLRHDCEAAPGREARPDVYFLYLRLYHSHMVGLVMGFVMALKEQQESASVAGMSQEDVLRLMDWIHRYAQQLAYLGEEDGADFPLPGPVPAFGLTDDLPHLASLYVHGEGGAASVLSRLSTNLADAALADGAAAVRRHEDGTHFTSMPTDLFNMLNENIRLAAAPGVDALLVRVLQHCGSVMLTTYQRVVERVEAEAERAEGAEAAEGEQGEEGPSIEYLMAVINDGCKLMELGDALVEEQDEDVREAVEEAFADATTEVMVQARRVAARLARLIFSDVQPALQQLFRREWREEDSMEAVCVTIADYLDDCRSGMAPYMLTKFVWDVFDVLFEAYMRQLLTFSAGHAFHSEKLSADDVQRVRGDERRIEELIGGYLDDRQRLRLGEKMMHLSEARKLLTLELDRDAFSLVFYAMLEMHPGCSRELLAALHVIVGLRPDANKKVAREIDAACQEYANDPGVLARAGERNEQDLYVKIMEGHTDGIFAALRGRNLVTKASSSSSSSASSTALDVDDEAAPAAAPAAPRRMQMRMPKISFRRGKATR